MGSLLDKIKAESVRDYGCKLCAILAKLDKADASDLREAIAAPDVTGAAIARALTAAGHPIGAHPVSKHRAEQHG